MPLAYFADWFRALAAQQKLRRLETEAAVRLLESTGQRRVPEESDLTRWQLLGGGGTKEATELDRQQLRDQARQLADTNPYARNALLLHRHYVVGTGMQHEVHFSPLPKGGSRGVFENGTEAPLPNPPLWTGREQEGPSCTERREQDRLAYISSLWHQFLAANDWATGNRKDWEFCHRTWRDGECFLRLFRQPTWPPRIHFVDPETVAAHPVTGQPSHGIATQADNVEEPTAYTLIRDGGVETVDASLILHTKIGVDGNVKRGLSLFLPVVESLRRFAGWLDVELIQRKVASSIVLVRKHQQNHPGGLASFADGLATSTAADATGSPSRRFTLQPGTIVDAQGFDLQFLSPNTHFDDASLLGRQILLSIAAGLGLPEFMLTSDASNANYASTLAAEGPAVRQFAAWQSFFSGQWQKLFRMVMNEAARLGLIDASEPRQVELRLTPPPLATRNRLDEARADALYFDRGALSRRELARRDQADPEQMQRERALELTPSSKGD